MCAQESPSPQVREHGVYDVIAHLNNRFPVSAEAASFFDCESASSSLIVPEESKLFANSSTAVVDHSRESSYLERYRDERIPGTLKLAFDSYLIGALVCSYVLGWVVVVFIVYRVLDMSYMCMKLYGKVRRTI